MLPAKAQKKEKRYHLEVLDMREKLRRHLQDKQEDLTVSTTQAARIVGTTPAKLRKWDQEGLFPSEQRSSIDESSSQKRYNLRELARALIIQELWQQHPDIKAVAAFMQENAATINGLINDITSPSETNQNQEQPWKIKKCLTWAEDAYFWRMFVPRALYLSMRLLHEHTPDNDTWLFFPLEQEGIPGAECRIQNIEQLSEMGEVLLGYCSSEHPFFMLTFRLNWTKGPPSLLTGGLIE
jgi:DNA-binding transcriptional MerR regulator